MILNDLQIEQFILKPPHKEEIKAAIQLEADNKVHITGEGYKKVLKRILDSEDEKQYAQRQELAEPITKVLSNKVITEQSRWLNARGTNKHYDFGENKDLSQTFRQDILSQVWKNQSMHVFITEFLRKALYTDFNGFILVEQGRIEEQDGKKFEVRNNIRTPLKKGENPKPYLIFKDITDIVDFQSTGNKIEYLIYNFGEDEINGNKVKLFRVIDDDKDVIWFTQNGKAQLSPKHKEIPNKLGYTPAIQVSVEPQDILIDEVKTSPIEPLVPLFKLYLTQYSQHTITAILHNYPIYYQMGSKCRFEKDGNKCENGVIYGSDKGSNEEAKCPNCDGAGYEVRKKASKAIILPQVDGDDKPFDISNVAGYVQPDIKSQEQQMNHLNWIESKIMESGTGMKNLATTTLSKTATEAILNTKPLEDIISGILNGIETVETFLTDAIGSLSFEGRYKKSDINYGRRLNLRDENEILKEIDSAKKTGASFAYIKALNEELVFSRYKNSKLELQKQLTLVNLEPLIGFTLEELNANVALSDQIKRYKYGFNDAVEQWESENGPIQDFDPDNPKRLLTLREQLIAITDKTANVDAEPEGDGA